MAMVGRETGVPASTAGIGVGVAVGGMEVGRGMEVGAGVASGAQAVSKIRNKRRIETRFFIIIPFPKRKTKE
jgi:F0F1-type ATP synthase membrane subunit c/vacuolar-type H+-ATPase subunit K